MFAERPFLAGKPERGSAETIAQAALFGGRLPAAAWLARDLVDHGDPLRDHELGPGFREFPHLKNRFAFLAALAVVFSLRVLRAQANDAPQFVDVAGFASAVRPDDQHDGSAQNVADRSMPVSRQPGIPNRRWRRGVRPGVCFPQRSSGGRRFGACSVRRDEISTGGQNSPLKVTYIHLIF